MSPIYYNTSDLIIKINNEISRDSKTYRLCNCGNPLHNDSEDEE